MSTDVFMPNLMHVSGVDEDVQGAIHDLLTVWSRRRFRNFRRSLYYDTEQAFRDLGIALPPQLKNAEFYLGWATQAVRKPALRSQFDGIRLPGSDDPLELADTLALNRFPLEFGQAIVSAYTHGMSLVTVFKDEAGQVQIQAHSADACAAIWDYRTRSLLSALTISGFDSQGHPNMVTVYLRDRIVIATKDDSGAWAADVALNRVGRVLAVPVVNDPQLRRPLGRSRITRAVMALTDMAVRTYVRMEGNAELYSAPQLALMGVSEAAFEALSESDAKKFKLVMDRVLGLTKDEDGDVPVLTQLQQASMVPHSDMLRTVATAFSGETGIPPSSLGIVHDQPASAEAIRAAEHDLLIDATYHNTFVHSHSVKSIMTLAVMVRDGLTEPPADALKLSVRFADPEFRSLSAQADAVQKLAADMSNIANWGVLLDKVFPSDEVARIHADKRRQEGASLIDRLNQVRVAPGARSAEQG